MPLPYSLDLLRLAAAYADRSLTPVRVARDVLDAIAGSGDNPIWIHRVPEGEVLDRARAVEARRAGGERLPLYGLPFAVKDNINVAGHPTTAACPAYSYVARESAFVVRLLEAAGAILVGKTNLDQFATGLVGTRSPYGACRNAFDRDYIAGGSSSGSALAVACGLASFALGTDTAGSGRVPAGFGNVVGLKPTRGLVSTRGVVPACRSLDCVSVFALTCEDATAVLEVVQRGDPEDPFSCPVAITADAPQQLRCGVPRAVQLEFFGDAAARDAFGRSLAALPATGADIVEVDYAPFLEVARLLYEGPWVAERYAAVGKFVSEHADDVDPVVRGIIAGAGKWSAADVFEGQYRLRELVRHCEAEWARMDVLVVPTAGTIYTLDQIAASPVQCNGRLGHYTNFVNLLDLCALAVPGPFRAGGLPAGITLIARAGRDAMLAEIGSRFHHLHGLKLGATPFELPPAGAARPAAARGEVLLAVAGAHLSGLPLNHQLTGRGARLAETTRTAACYRLYALAGTEPPKPGLARAVNGAGAAIEVELWSLSAAAFGSFVAEVPPPLAIGTVELVDGRRVKGFLCEGHALEGAVDITRHGGWRAYLAAGRP